MSLLVLFQQGAAQTLALTGIPSAEAFGVLTLAPGNASLSLTGIPSAEAFGIPTYSATAGLPLTGIGTAEAFGSFTFSSGTAALNLAGIASAEAFGTPVFSAAASLPLTGISSSESFGLLTLSPAAALALTGIASGEIFGTPFLEGDVFLALAGIGSTEAFGSFVFTAHPYTRSVTFPNGQTLTSGALTPNAVNVTLQTLTCQMLGYNPFSATDPAYAKVRLGWPAEGQPGWAIGDDVCFLRASEEDDPYNKIRDRKYDPLHPAAFTQTDTYTRVWRVSWSFYGPNGFDNARLVKSALIGVDFAHDALAASNLYLVNEAGATTRAPEKFQGQWWERADLSVRLNELVTETLTIDAMSGVEVLVFTERGEAADLLIS